MSDYAIKAEGLGKKYRIGQSYSGEIRGTFDNLFRNRLINNKTPRLSHQSEFWALEDINFEIPIGEAVGIIGRNGAGKSTLLKILSRITEPTTGRVEIEGRVSSLLEVGTGFHPELTGRENIYLNGTILGMSRKEVKIKFDEIVTFSGVEKFINTPIKHYSSGMKVRLAFSVAAHLEPEILLIDEVLAVGDADFQTKCLGKMEEITGFGRTIIFVSHNLNAVRKLCKKGILLKEGKLELYSDTREVISEYLKTMDVSCKDVDHEIVKYVEAYFENGILVVNLKFREYNLPKPPFLGIVVKDSTGTVVYGTNPKLGGNDLSDSVSSGSITCKVLEPILSPDTYMISVWFGDGYDDIYHGEDLLTITSEHIENLGKPIGVVQPKVEFQIEDDKQV